MKAEPEKWVLSASRRTDIPAFYMDEFMEHLRKGAFESVNPYNGRRSMIPAAPETIHTIVFWSKNFGPFLQGRYGERLLKRGFHLFFNFTVNSASKLLEPKVPPLAERLQQMETLAERFGPQTVQWRFDPVCWLIPDHDGIQDNLADLEEIADQASRSGIDRCITSFMDPYPKIAKRIRTRGGALQGFTFIDPPLEQKTAVLMQMERVLRRRGIRLSTCCEKEVLEALPDGAGVESAACISNDRLMALFGGRLPIRRDSGQRVKHGCGCQVSVDVGSYRRHPCFHGCRFCYANPA